MRNGFAFFIFLSLVLLLPITSTEFFQNAYYSIQADTHDKKILEFSTTNNTIMKYYPRKFLTIGNALLYHPVMIDVKVAATDPDGIDSVIMKFRYENASVWNQSVLSKLDEVGDLYTGTIQFKTNSTSTTSFDSVTIQVQYVANDTLNNTAMSPVMNFTYEFGLITVDGVSPLYNTPDLWYLFNTTGHEVTWATQGVGTPHPFTLYILYQDDFLLEQYRWSGDLTIDVDGLPLGNHVYDLTVALGAWPTNDNVTVHVVDVIPIGVTTGSVGPITGSMPTYSGFNLGPLEIPIIMMLGLVLAIGIVGYFQYQ